MSNIITNPPPPLFRIESAGAEVVANGTVLTFTADDVAFVLDDLRFTFRFLVDDKGQRLDAEQRSAKEVLYRIYNFHNPLGTGLKEPIKIGRIRGKDLFFCFSTYAHDEKTVKLVHYTFFAKEAASV